MSFCAQCGQRLGVAGEGHDCQETAADPYRTVPASQRMVTRNHIVSKRSKRLASLIAGFAGLAAIAYGFAHYTYGPATPEKLESKLQAAVAEHNVDALLEYLDPSNENMKKAELVEAFKKAFNDDTASSYSAYLKFALASAEQREETKKDQLHASDLAAGPILFVKKENWRGTKWSFQVMPSQVTFANREGWTVTTSIGALKNADGIFKDLWPAVYTYESDISNLYGGKQKVKGKIDLIENTDASVILADEVESAVLLTLPAITGVSFKLNGIELPKPAEMDLQTVTITPAPARLKVAAVGTYLGRPIDESDTLVVSGHADFDLAYLIRQAVAEETANLLLKANVSWTKARNAGKMSSLAGWNPDGDAYRSLARAITAQGDRRVHLVRLGILPSEIELYEDEIIVGVSEEYAYPGSGKTNETFRSTYVITKKPNQNEWWISSSSKKFVGTNKFEQKHKIVKINDEQPDAVQASPL